MVGMITPGHLIGRRGRAVAVCVGMTIDEGRRDRDKRVLEVLVWSAARGKKTNFDDDDMINEKLTKVRMDAHTRAQARASVHPPARTR